ncbi:MAG: hypothetical protein KAI84_21530 [Gammaproteobacteria bacterium]|nr:hypothetical protein [Gammaproteobacteria bacterium]
MVSMNFGLTFALLDSEAWRLNGWTDDSDDDDRSSEDEAAGDNCAGRIVLGIGLSILTGGLLG